MEHYCDLRGFDNDRKVVIKERFEKFGGKARSVFGASRIDTLEAMISKGIEKLLERQKPKDKDHKDNEDQVFYRFPHQELEDTYWCRGMLEPIYGFGSQYIAKTYSSMLLHHSALKCRSVASLMSQGFGDLGGRIFEDLIHSFFKSSKNIINFATEDGRPIQIRHKGWKYYKEGDDVKVGFYYETSHDFPSFDSFIVRPKKKIDIFQITAQRRGRKNINIKKGLDKIKVGGKLKVGFFYYIVLDIEEHAKLMLTTNEGSVIKMHVVRG